MGNSLKAYLGDMMKTGKLTESVLKRSVLKQLHTKRPEIIKGASAGENCAVIALDADEVMVLATDPITATTKDIGRMGVIVTLNDIACTGAEPVGVLISLLLPTSINEEQLRDITKDIDAICKKANVQVVGGHTEVTRAVKEPLITVTGVGKAKKNCIISSRGAEPGMDILVTNWVGLEGTSILAKEKEDELRTRFAQPFLNRAKAFDTYLPVWKEAAVATMSGVVAMHNISEGGIFAALWEMAESSGVGLEIDIRKIPIRQETVEICEFFDLNPYKLLGNGSIIMAAKDGNAMVRAIEKEGGMATVVGKATAGNDRVLIQEEERRYLETPQTDEIHKVIK